MPASNFSIRLGSVPVGREIATGTTVLPGQVLTEGVGGLVVATNAAGFDPLYIVATAADPTVASFTAPEIAPVVRIDMCYQATLIAGAAITAGAQLTVSNGKVITAVSTNKIIGTAIQATTADGQYVDVRFYSQKETKA